MKSFIVAMVIIGTVAVAGTIAHLDKKAQPVPVPVVTEASPESVPSEKIAILKREEPPAVSGNQNETVPTPAVEAILEEVKPEPVTKLSKTIDALISPQMTLPQKRAIYQQLLKDGQLEQAMAELKQRATDDPNNPAIPTTLGEAQLNQLVAVRDAGGNNNQVGILAMQADESFNAALKLDPSNWEAQFMKDSAMYHWPANPQWDSETVQRLSSLIDQQETMASQPEFAQTYVVLGQEFQKIGQPDKAIATWQLGLTKFPGDPALQKMANR